MPKEVEIVHNQRFEFKLDYLTSVMTSLTENTRQRMEYKEDLVQYTLAFSQNAIIFVAKKV